MGPGPVMRIVRDPSGLKARKDRAPSSPIGPQEDETRPVIAGILKIVAQDRQAIDLGGPYRRNGRLGRIARLGDVAGGAGGVFASAGAGSLAWALRTSSADCGMPPCG